jgi:hypothetical protein
MEEFLNGSKGVEALDLAREVLTLRAQCQALQEECNRLVEQCNNFAAVAEMTQGNYTTAREKLGTVCMAMADMHAGLVEFLK